MKIKQLAGYLPYHLLWQSSEGITYGMYSMFNSDARFLSRQKGGRVYNRNQMT
jgi:hypothetical protein